MMKNGNPTRMIVVCNASRPPDPEKTSKVAVITAMAIAQKMRWPSGLKSSCPLVMVSVTSAAESTDVTKKMITRMMAIADTTAANGKCCKKANGAPGISSCSTTRSTRPPSPRSSMSNEAKPKIPNQITENVAGMASTPETNCLIVLPREIRAINIPTNGDHVMVHAQSNTVH